MFEARPRTKPRLGLVVPSLEHGGGVPAVARFLKDVALRDGMFDLRLVSLSTSAYDAGSVRMSSPASWLRGVKTSAGVWEGQSFVHVGAVCSEFEFQRYRPRRALADLLADCDVIQVVCGSPAWANSMMGLGKPLAVHVATRARVERRRRDSTLRSASDWWRKAMTEITDRMDDRVLRRVEAIQVMNPWMLDYARKTNSKRDADIRIAPTGVNATLFHPLDRRAPMQDSYILSVARFDDPRKNVFLLLQAYAGLPPELRANVRLVLAGSSGPPPAFWQKAEALGLRERVSWVARPDRSALVSLYQRATVFALPSDEEGFGMVLLEAMSCGVPVVSTRSGGPDGIITDGADGYLVPLDDAAMLSARLKQLLMQPELNIEMGRIARNTIEARFDERVAGEFFVEMWSRMASSGQRP